jgi:2-polyprenyl-3-methyl-5-hydroxy-6-metoxy-1,4-benzoquinol methylase
VSARARNEAVWEALEPGLDPSDYALRARFLLANVAPGERVLDVGAGEGRFAAALAKAGASVLAADIAEEPLRRARAAIPDLAVHLLPDEADWGLADSDFDVVWAGEVIEHVADTAGWLSEARRVLRPGGALLLSTPDHGPLTRLRIGLSARAFSAALDPRSEHLRLYTRAALTRLLVDYRFADVDVRGAGGLPGARRVLLARAVRARY